MMDDVVFELYGRVQKKRTGVAAAPALCSTASVIPYFRDQRELDPMEWGKKYVQPLEKVT
jgi:hypothetical protein